MKLALGLRSFGVAFGDHVVINDVTFRLATAGMTVLVGPAGSGKSTLLRTLAGLNDNHPSLTTWGTIALGDMPLMGGQTAGLQRPALVMQHARFFLDTVRENLVSALPNRAALEQLDQTRIVTERLRACGLGALAAYLPSNAVDLPLGVQRQLAIARALMPEPRVLFADEPMAGLDDDDAIEIIAMLRLQAYERAVVLVTHNQRYALAAGGTTMLLAGGRIQEIAATQAFFASPRTELARCFLRTGGCVAAPEPQETPPEPQETPSRFLGPRGFFWALPGRLGGTPRPGIIDEVEQDLEGLRRLGVTVLVTLEETATVAPEALAALGIESLHFPIPDMGTPGVEAALGLSRRIAAWMAGGEVVAVHCRAGLGRTGTVLACQLIAGGMTAQAALDAIRGSNPGCVQSLAQVELLREFAAAMDLASKPKNETRPEAETTERGDHTWH
jgi:atypical dual specificity phosphatase